MDPCVGLLVTAAHIRDQTTAAAHEQRDHLDMLQRTVDQLNRRMLDAEQAMCAACDVVP